MKSDTCTSSNMDFYILKKKAISLALIILFIASLPAQTFPPGFSQVAVGTIYYPTSLAFAPDGRIFTTEKAGKVKIIKNGTVLTTPFLQVAVDQLNERGLSSVAIDPDFNTNHFVYIYYTTASSPIHNRLSRFTANGDVAVAGSEQVLIEFEPCVGSIHNGGGMAFGPDGKLYIAIGNDNVNTNSQDLNNYKGKLLRINPDGSVPAGNPFTGTESAKRIWAFGFRNPWSVDIQPGTGKIFVNDVGEGAWEEINDATQAGKNFGWPAAEGNSSNPAYTNPVYTYPHGTTGSNDGCAITGGAFFNPSSTNYPSQYNGKYFFIDYCNKWINYLDLSSGVQKVNFGSSLTFASNYLKVGPDGNLYYFSIGQNILYKIIYSNNSAPVITSQPTNKTVSQGQSVTFNVSASGATPLTYQWMKSGVNISGANGSAYTISNTQPSNAGQYSVKVTNSYGSTTSNTVSLTVTAFNANPVATIISPTIGSLYRHGDIINFSGSATDPENGVLPASSFTWTIEFHHDQHIHPGPFVPTGVTTGTFSTAFGETSANIYFRLILVVKDLQGLADTATVDIHPVTSTLNIASQPSGLQVLLDAQPHTTPYSVLAVSGITRALNIASPQTLNGTNYIFDHWSQGGNVSQNILITDNNATYTAVFAASGTVTTCSATGNITRDYWANVAGTGVASIPVNSTPTSSGLRSVFEGPIGAGSDYGSRFRGYICPPLTGNYIFWIASDDNSELWLSTNENPSGKFKIASVPGWTQSREWTKYPSQQSVSINLIAGVKYYIEALHKQGTQGDHVAVAWQLPNGSQEKPIPGSRLSPFVTGSTPLVSISSPADNSSFSSSSNITIVATASSANTISKVEFFQGSSKLGEDFSNPYNFLWSNVPAGNYTLTAKATDASNNSGTSAPVKIAVSTCSTPTIFPNGPTTLCSGGVLLKCNTGTNFIYQWKKDGVNIPGATSSSYSATASGSYQIKIINGSCVTWSAPMTVSIQNNLSARITPGGPTTFCNGQKVTLYANTCTGYSYQWILNNNPINGAINSTYIATIGGSYQLMVTQGSLKAWSSLVPVTVNACRIIEETVSEAKLIESSKDLFQMKVYPNPTNGMFTFSINMPTDKNEKAEMNMVNTLGQIVYSKEYYGENGFINQTVELDNSNPPGIYILQIKIGDQVETTNVMLVK